MYHQVLVVGNVGKEPEMRYTPSGQAVTSFSVASNRKYTTRDEEVTETIWFRVTAWGKLAETCNEYLGKGMKVLVEGRLTPDKETGGPHVYKRQDGTSGANFEIKAAEVRFLSGRKDGDSGIEEEEDIPGFMRD